MNQMPLKLIVEYALAPGSSTAFAFAKDRVSIGRAPANDVQLSSARRLVSRQHAEIRWENGLIWLVDLGSTNATWLNEQRLEAARPYALRHGDRFQVGDFRIEVLVCEPEPAS